MKEKTHWIITADVHAGDVPGALPCREEDIYQTWQQLCKQAAIDPHCMGIIGLGDLRDKPNIQSRNLDGFNRGVRTLHETGKVLLALVGNHDMTSPLWILAMHHPGIEDLSNPTILEKHNINPEKTLASHYKNRKELTEWFHEQGEEKIKKVETVFLHLALEDLSAANQKCETSIKELSQIGFGSSHPTTFFLGDLHNYGDITKGNLTAVYSGSPEMTDRNEGINGLKSSIHPIKKPDFRKFAIRWWPEGKGNTQTQEWERFQIPSRPWYYVRVPESKSKTLKGQLEMAKKTISQWTPEKPGILNLIIPKKEILSTKELFQKEAQEGKLLTFNVEGFSKEIHGDDENQEEPKPGPGNWSETKTLLPEMGEEAKLSPRAIALLQELIKNDGATNHPKTDVANAWETWRKKPNPQSQEPIPRPIPELISV